MQAMLHFRVEENGPMLCPGAYSCMLVCNVARATARCAEYVFCAAKASATLPAYVDPLQTAQSTKVHA